MRLTCARHGWAAAARRSVHAAQALQSGSLEVRAIGDTRAVSGRAGGVDTRAIIVEKPVGDAWLLVRKTGISRVAELAGQRVGLQFGSNFDKYGRSALKDAGILEQVQLINIPIPDAFAALTRGDIDAVGLPANTAATWLRKDAFPVLDRASRDHPELQGTSVTLVMSRFLKDHPTLQTAWWQATRAGIEAIQRDPDAYRKFVSEATGVPLDAVRESMPLRYGERAIDPEGKASVSSTLEFLLAFGTAKARSSIDDWVVEPSAAESAGNARAIGLAVLPGGGVARVRALVRALGAGRGLAGARWNARSCRGEGRAAAHDHRMETDAAAVGGDDTGRASARGAQALRRPCRARRLRARGLRHASTAVARGARRHRAHR